MPTGELSKFVGGGGLSRFLHESKHFVNKNALFLKKIEQ